MYRSRMKKQLAGFVLLSVLAMPFVAQAAGSSIVSNDRMPTGGSFVAGGGTISSPDSKLILDIVQNGANSIIKWEDFSIGANGTVNFTRKEGGSFNSLNYVDGGNMSQIYGKLNAQGGNIFLVNPNGVQIGNSAQINVGSLHVANKRIDNLNAWTIDSDFAKELQKLNNTNADLMSLGHITADKLTFEGSRVVLDLDRINVTDKVNITGSEAQLVNNDFILGTSDVSDDNMNSWAGKISFNNGQVQTGVELKDNFAYRWIKDGAELGYIGKGDWGLGDNYALRYAIDLTEADQQPIGASADKAFSGKFDGLHNNIFGLTMDNSDNSKGGATGLFGYTNGATIGNFKLIAGTDGVSIKGGESNTGTLIGHAVNTKVRSVANTLKVSGKNNVGGLIGYAENSSLQNMTNTGTVKAAENVGGILGKMVGGTLGVNETDSEESMTHNLGRITGDGDASHNIGGLVGSAENAVIGAGAKNADGSFSNNKNELLNAAIISGGYNVGGIVGSVAGTRIFNANNESNIIATGFTTEDYIFRTDYTGDRYFNAGDGLHKESVRMANVGGIAGSTSADSELRDVENSGNVESKLVKATSTGTNKPTAFDHYGAGNVGGIVGKSLDTNITNATNFESTIRGAMNVGGVAGYFGSTTDAAGKFTIADSENDGGNILASGGILEDGSDFIHEITRSDYRAGQNNEYYISGNIGGIAGMLSGDAVYINGAVNRGTVHTEGINVGSRANTDIPLTATAANIGGIAGKMDRSKNNKTELVRLGEIKADSANAVISSSYNNGDVRGYANIGGIAGFAYNGSIASSYNIGKINTTRSDVSGTTPINMGGILGDSTEMATGRVVLYDVYNKGELGDKNFTYLGRHVGGVVGRLSGVVEKAYNTGDIYNGSNVTGGVVGYWYAGQMKNVFNTGNITVVNKNANGNANDTSQVGGIVGSVDVSGGNTSDGTNQSLLIKNAYNLGTLRSFKGGIQKNALGGIIGQVVAWTAAKRDNTVTISDVYTTGNFYVDGGSSSVGAIIGKNDYNASAANIKEIKNAFYITPTDNSGFTSSLNNRFASETHLSTNQLTKDSFTKLANAKLDIIDQNNGKLNLGDKNAEDTWRIYDDGLPILNAFLPAANKYFGDKWSDLTQNKGVESVQYGTAYDPLLTIVKANKNQIYDLQALGIHDNGSIAVYGAGLTLNNVTTLKNHLFSGTVYSDGELVINVADDAGAITLGAASQLYGASVELNTKGKLSAMGKIQATGNKLTGISDDEGAKLGNVVINSGELDIYGEITTAKQGSTTTVAGLGGKSDYTKVYDAVSDVKDSSKQLTKTGAKLAYTTGAAARNGDLEIVTTAAENGTTTGDTNIRFGNLRSGKLDVAGSADIISDGSLLIDTDLRVDGAIRLNSAEDSILDLTNIGASDVQSGHNAKAIHEFIDKHSDAEHGIIGAYFSGVKIALDVWNEDKELDGKKGNLDYAQYDYDGVKLSDKLKKLYVESYGQDYSADNIKNVIYTWISSADQLNAIQHYVDNGDEGYKDRILSYNFMLKNDIDASELTDYKSIGSGDKEFTGTFDGRNQRIVGLNAKNGLFMNNAGTIQNIRVYSSVFTGAEDESIGAIAANNGYGASISGITGLGNTIHGTKNNIIGGLIGSNSGWLMDSSDESTVIAGEGTVAGGLVGINDDGQLSDVQTNSAVTTAGISAGKYAENLGGIAGKNMTMFLGGTIDNAVVRGVTGKAGSTKIVGGIVGTNNGMINYAYNESLVHGAENVGGIAGINDAGTTGFASIDYAANALEIIGDAGSKNVGGLVGSQKGYASIANARNTGVVQGMENVGGFVGYNDENSQLNGLENAPQASIVGEINVGGIAGWNKGSIEDVFKLVNQGTISGQQNVGGVAGYNEGYIKDISVDVTMRAKDGATAAQYFGGIAGKNDGVIENALNKSYIDASGAQYVGGIVGWNTDVGKLVGMGNESSGTVIGANYVGGVIGLNDSKISHWLDTSTNSYAKTGVTNSGTVLATNGGAGGLIGVNNADIEDSTWTNKGTVQGTTPGGTGGIFGVNKGKIKDTDLINTIDGKVIGQENVGGLVGINEGEIAGGRRTFNTSDASHNEDAGYYATKIYNNGTISTRSQNAGAAGSSSTVQNIGGLIGWNKGKLSAAYNTGAIDAIDGTNVGGIVGFNEGTGSIDQAFNTIAVRSGSSGAYSWSEGAVTGKENVGGIVGSNAGTVTNAYNSTTVAGTTSIGSIAGNNSGTISKTYDSKAQAGQQLVGSGAGASESFIYEAGTENAKKKESYNGFDFTNTWKGYEGSNSPLLKVFLTKVTYDASKDAQSFVYNGSARHKDIDRLINDRALSDASGSEFDDYNKGKTLNGTSLINNDGKANKDAGSYTEALWSAQIGMSADGSQNYLGYDLPEFSYDIAKAKLTVSLNDVERTYGNATITNGSYSVKDMSGLVAGDSYTASDITITATSDGAVDGVSGERVTNDAGSYVWSGTASSSNAELNKNYDIVVAGNAKSEVKKAQLQVSLKDVERTYGNSTITSGSYRAGSITGNVNGDSYTASDITVSATSDGAVDGVSGERVTNDAGSYEWSGSASSANTELNNNYDIVVAGNAKSEVKKAQLNFVVDDKSITKGATPTYTGTHNGLVNGDTLESIGFGGYDLDSSANINVVGEYVDTIGVLLSGSLKLTGDNNLLRNYNLEITPGTLTVSDRGTPKPPDPIDPPQPPQPPYEIDGKNDYWYSTAPWDRERHFRERKAEFNYVDGGEAIPAEER